MRQAFRLSLKKGSRELLVSNARIDGEGAIVNLPLPHALGLEYVVAPRGGGDLHIETEHFDIEPMGCIGSAIARARANTIRGNEEVLRFDRFNIFATGPWRARRVFWETTRYSRQTAAPLDGPLREAHPELWRGWSPAPSISPRARPSAIGSARYAIVLHLYHADVWEEVSAVLARVTPDFDLIVTTVAGREPMIADLRRAYPMAEIHVGENRGRDIGPFLGLLEKGRLDRYPYICKIHGKASQGRMREPIVGAMWRRRLFFDLLAAPGVEDVIHGRFAADPRLGVLGSRACRYPNAHKSLAVSWGPNQPDVLKLSSRMGDVTRPFRLDFFAGSMFWARPEALRPLRDLELSRAFPEEAGSTDGALEHCVERLFTPSARAAGYAIQDIDGAEIARET